MCQNENFVLFEIEWRIRFNLNKIIIYYLLDLGVSINKILPQSGQRMNTKLPASAGSSTDNLPIKFV